MRKLRLNLKNLIACGGLLLAMVSCKKNTIESSEQVIVANNTTGGSTAKELLDSRKALFVLDYSSVTNLTSIYRITGLTTIPVKFPLFTGEPDMFVKEVCPGAGVNNVYFSYYHKGDGFFGKAGIWNLTLDGKKKQIVQFKNSTFYNGLVSELEFDRVNNKIYWSEQPQIEGQPLEIWRCNTNGSGKEQISIKGVLGLNNLGRFAVDGLGGRIFFQYSKPAPVYANVIGSCDLKGNVITPVVANIKSSGYKLDLDIVNQKFYLSGILQQATPEIFVGNMNANGSSAKALISSNFFYSGVAYDFLKPTLYFGKSSFENTEDLFASDFQGGNEKSVIGGFSNIYDVSGIFTDQ